MIDFPTRSDAAKLSDEQLLQKLQGFGLEVDRAELERLCEGALSAEEVAHPLLDPVRCRGHERAAARGLDVAVSARAVAAVVARAGVRRGSRRQDPGGLRRARAP